MKVITQQIITVTEKMDKSKLSVIDYGHKDVDSINITVEYDGIEIGNGSYNLKTNFAHITMNDDNEHLTDYIVSSIEDRSISII